MENRKKDHILMALSSRLSKDKLDKRFYYEPMLAAHPDGAIESLMFGRKKMKVPVWVSSMTGGTEMAGTINRNLAKACKEFGMGMGLGSCRIILDDDRYFDDFNMRPLIGDQPLYANLGIAQLEAMIRSGDIQQLRQLIESLDADGLIIHVNPVQEWFQPEGDRIDLPPIETIKTLLKHVSFPLVVKEVGQGFGYESMKQLLGLPLQAIEFGAFGGTNFAKLELARRGDKDADLFEPMTRIGHDAADMLDMVNDIFSKVHVKTQQLIISGGITSFLDGYYLVRKSKLPAVYGMASAFLEHSRNDYSELQQYTRNHIKGLEMAFNYLKLRVE